MGTGCLLLQDDKEPVKKKIFRKSPSIQSHHRNSVRESNPPTSTAVIRHERFDDLLSFSKPLNKQLPARIILLSRILVRGSFLDPIICGNKWTSNKSYLLLFSKFQLGIEMKEVAQGLSKMLDMQLGIEKLMVDDYFLLVMQKYNPAPTLLSQLTAESFKESLFRSTIKKCIQLLTDLEKRGITFLDFDLQSFRLQGQRLTLGPLRIGRGGNDLAPRKKGYAEAMGNFCHVACCGRLPYYNQLKKEYQLKLQENMPQMSFGGMRFIEQLYKERTVQSFLYHQYFQLQLHPKTKQVALTPRVEQLQLVMKMVDLACPRKEESCFFEQGQAHVLQLCRSSELEPLKIMLALQTFFYDKETIKELIEDSSTPMPAENLKKKLSTVFREKAAREIHRLSSLLEDSLSKEVLVNVTGFLQYKKWDALRMEPKKIGDELVKLID